MGWDFGPYENKASLVTYLTKQFETDEDIRTCIAHKSVSCGLWSVWEIADKTGKTSRVIGLDLIKGSKGHYGYKSIGENMGPCYYSCPLAFMDMVEEPKSRYSEGWRAKVRAFHASKV